MSTTTSTSTSTYTPTTRHTLSRRNGRGGLTSISTPNLNQLFTSHSTRRAPPALSRKGSVAALTQNSLASIPDDSEDYAYNSVLASHNHTSNMPSPLTPGTRAGAGELAIGDIVDVPGNLTGVVRFVGSVGGRNGTFAGVELLPEHAARGKNSGDVDGISYFTTEKPGAGIFLPLSKAIKREPSNMSSTPGSTGGSKAGTQHSTTFTPPTPGVPKFSQSVGPGRASSPIGKRSRPSLPRPESPVRRPQVTPAPPRPSIGVSAVKSAAATPRYGSPTPNKFAQSVRGTAGDPSKRPPTHGRKGSVGPRSVSVLGVSSTHHLDDDDMTMPIGAQRMGFNGGLQPNFAMSARPVSRAASRLGNNASSHEVERLKAELEERDRQLKEQAMTLAEMESSLTELQGLIENSEGSMQQLERRNSFDDKDSATLRKLLAEKSEKIALLTAEFDAHRADFRSTIDTLEMASTETERVYEKKIEELMQEIQDLQDRTADVDTVATQLKQLEELVQELEEGLEDARRGEAEARGEVEFLRGEVERTRSELRREREKAQAATNGSPNGGVTSKELEQKEDEIRGLKAIIHSLSRDSIPNDQERTPTAQQPPRPHQGESIEERLSREKLEREVAELRALVESKTAREETLERELETLRRGVNAGPGNRGSAMTSNSGNDRNSYRDSRGTVVLAPRSEDGSNNKNHSGKHSRGNTLDTMPESDSYSTATENSTLWCEICETSGHDILTCTNVFPEQKQTQQRDGARTPEMVGSLVVPGANDDIKPAPLSSSKPKPTFTATITPMAAPAPAPIYNMPNLMESGPAPGKSSGVIDESKWCAICERDGHDSVDCPFEDQF
ncbi:Tip elongation protein 1 [Podospora fimiseda]|uniref:Tip elongation protein 1 n=1 Tax=Podospora fimiseda TaxID=252190 RepID=A0AAN7BMN4_9PEZI|nr:Tip elongation protein 1 [Podospora fimiseda]